MEWILCILALIAYTVRTLKYSLKRQLSGSVLASQLQGLAFDPKL